MSLVRFVLSSFWYNDIFKNSQVHEKSNNVAATKARRWKDIAQHVRAKYYLLLVLPSFLVRFPMKELHMVYSII